MDRGALSSELGLSSQIDSNRNATPVIQTEVKFLTEYTIAACEGFACIIDWQSPYSSGAVTTTTASLSDSALTAVKALVERRLRRTSRSSQSIHLQAGEIAAYRNGDGVTGTPIEAMALATSDDALLIVTIVVAPLRRSISQLEATAQLANGILRARLHEASTEQSLEFWRARASANAERLTDAAKRQDAAVAEYALIESTVATCMKLSARKRFANLGATIASAGGFDAWMIAIGSPGTLQIMGSSAAFVPTPRLEVNGVIADAIKRSATIIRKPKKTKARASEEDRMFARYAAYMCVPFAGGAIALAAHEEIASAVQHRVEEVVRRLNPVIEKWLLDDRLNSLTQLVRTLGVRLFTAIDNERQRIARDLHDHQAQLITAARIALEADPTEARGILKQLDEVLRLRIRELRPATLGRSNLQEALRHEIQRLCDAGIRARVLHPTKAQKLSRPVQQLCYQLVREALSNVIRHAAATCVTIAVEQHDGLARIVIEDNGKGFRIKKGKRATSHHADGSGLIGMAERVELMGGKFSIERIDKITRLTAAIPEL